MLRFHGHHYHTLDAKGRLSIPAKFREILKAQYDERLMISFLDGCLTAYPYTEWEKLVNRFLSLPQHNKKVKAFMRGYISAVEECPLDSQGRILLPPVLRERAGIKEKVMILGCLYKIEIWDYATGLPRVEEEMKETSEISEYLGEAFKF